MDTSDLQLLISQITAVNDQYTNDLRTGLYTPELYAEYKDKLAAAGVREYIDALQNQVSAWIAANK